MATKLPHNKPLPPPLSLLKKTNVKPLLIAQSALDESVDLEKSTFVPTSTTNDALFQLDSIHAQSSKNKDTSTLMDLIHEQSSKTNDIITQMNSTHDQSNKNIDIPIEVDSGSETIKGGSLPPLSKKRQLTISVLDDNEEPSMYNSEVAVGKNVITVGNFEIGEHGISSGILTSLKSDLMMLSALGQGAGGVVFKAVHAPSLRIVAVKTIPVYDPLKRSQMINELTALYANIAPIDVGDAIEPLSMPAPCPFIVAFHDAFINSESSNVAMVVEYMDGGSLQDVIDSGGCENEPVLAQICYRILMGLQFIHSHHQIHRDIKPSNLLINHRGEVKISDFGIVRELDCTQALATTFVGTLTYMSPERINGSTYSANADIWSLGLSIMSVALGTYPLTTVGGYWGILHSVNEGHIPELPQGRFSQCFRDFVRLCLEKDPLTRPHTDDLLNHPFISSCKAFVDEQLVHGEDTPPTNTINCIAEIDEIAKAYWQALYNSHQGLPLEAPLEIQTSSLNKLAKQLGVSSGIMKQKFQGESHAQFMQLVQPSSHGI